MEKNMTSDGGRDTPMKITIYTCTFRDYDQLFSPLRGTPKAEFLFYSDRPQMFLRHWKWKPIPENVNDCSQTIINRYCKMMPHILMAESDITIYVDGSIMITGDLTPLINEFIQSGAPIGLFPQLRGRSFIKEAEEALKVGKITEQDEHLMRKQLKKYSKEGLPEETPLTANYIIFRNNSISDLSNEMDLWWRELNTFSQRDQISLPYVLYKMNTPVHLWNWNPTFYDNRYFKIMGHRKKWHRIISGPLHAFRHRITRLPDVPVKKHGALPVHDV